MYLKRLELHGFKSFPDRTALEFNKGVTAVVGPNGSGKSNIADAVRWVLGEQSAKSLRGAKMEDVIFSGTENRRGVGVAEVALTIADTEGIRIAGGDGYGELTVTRRVFRSGESQFLINNTPVRLKDIHELFMDTGVGREGYSIIGQGRIDEVLSAKSEDRRQLFEEAAGIVRYRTRKAESAQKLERERQNLERTDDIIAELDERLEPLSESAEKALRYLAVAERLKLVKVNLFLTALQVGRDEIAGAEQGIEDLRAQVEALETGRGEKKAAIERVKTMLAELDAAIEGKIKEHNALNTTAEKKETDIRLAKQHIEYIGENTARMTVELESRGKAVAARQSEKDALVLRIDGLEAGLDVKQRDLTAQNHCAAVFEADVKAFEDGIAAFSAEHIGKINLTSDLKARAERLTVEYEQAGERKEEISAEILLLEEKIRENSRLLSDTDKAVLENAEAGQKIEADIRHMSGSKDTLQSELDELNARLVKESAALSEARQRQKLLGELEAGLEGYGFSVKNVMSAVKNGVLTGIRGSLGSLISVEKTYEICVETALGGAISDIICGDEADAKAAIEFLKRTNGGRATFLPLSAVKPRDLGGAKTELLRGTGILGAAADFVFCGQEIRNVILNILGRVIVADTYENAVAFSRKYRYEYRVVTLGGELINPGGSITGGSRGRNAGILSRRRELDSLSGAIPDMEARAEGTRKLLNETADKLNSVIAHTERAKMRRQELLIEKASLESASAQAKRLRREYDSALAALKKTDGEITERLASLNKAMHDGQRERIGVETEIEGLLNEIGQKQTRLDEMKCERDKHGKALVSAQAEISRLLESLAGTREHIARIDRETAELYDALERTRSEIAALEIEKEEKLCQISDIKRDIERLRDGQAGLDKEIAELRERKIAGESEYGSAQAEEIRLIELQARLNLELERLTLKRDKAEAEWRGLHDEMWEEYNITPQSARQYEVLRETPQKLRAEEQRLKAELRGMGQSVNPNAVEEYRMVKERYEFLTKQRDDIRSAEARLEGVIGELNKLMETQFVEQLKKISDNFGQVFSEMFGGGTARLELSDASNALESGIEITTQPPGKVIRHLSLMSGGERALSAIALLFGILRMKPSPFCILDEIETALDEANVGRFASFLKRASGGGGTQFIVITHSKGIMEAADALYGVTMQDAGVSKLVSVKFVEGENKEG